MANGFAHIAKIHKATCSNADLKQEAWLALLKANKGFDQTKGVKFITYAYSYVYHELLKYVKKQTKLRGKFETANLDFLTAPLISSNSTPSMSGLGLVECHDLIDYVTADLSDHEKTLIHERFFNESNIKDIAELTEVSTATVSQHLDRTLEKMRRTTRRDGK